MLLSVSQIAIVEASLGESTQILWQAWESAVALFKQARLPLATLERLTYAFAYRNFNLDRSSCMKANQTKGGIVDLYRFQSLRGSCINR